MKRDQSAPPPGDEPPANAADLDELQIAAAQAEPPIDPPLNAAPAAPEIPTKDLVCAILAPGFALLAPAWQVSQAEIVQLSESYALVLDKYFPDGMGNFGPELAAAMVTLAVIGPRMGRPRKQEPAEPEKKVTPAAPGAPPAVTPANESCNVDLTPAGHAPAE